MQTNTSKVKSRPAMAASYVNWQVARLVNSGNEAASRAALAKLRRGLGKDPGSIPELWTYTLEGMPEELVGRGGKASWGEWSCYLAITLFAIHQQGKPLAGACMNRPGQGLGKAVRLLIQNDEDEQRVKRRFDQVLTAESPEEASHHLRSLVQLLRAQDIPLDYPALAADLYRFQIQEERDSVRLNWGRDYYSGVKVVLEPTDEPDNEENDRNEEESNEE